MTIQITATVVGGMLKPDEKLLFPEQTRVNLTIEPIVESGEVLDAAPAMVEAHHEPEGTGVSIVDRGRGPQLASCRITVQDLVPYLRQNCTPEEIMTIMPVLTLEEIQAIQHYVRENYAAVMEQDRLIRERNANRSTPSEIDELRRRGHAKALDLLEQFAKNKAREKNGDPSPR